MDLTPQSGNQAADQNTADYSDNASHEVETAARLGADALLALVQARLDDGKAEDVVTISLDGKSEIADALVIASGRSQTHVGSLADQLMRAIKEAGNPLPTAEGMPANDWVLLDAGDVIVHLFRPEVRQFYNLEKIWSEQAWQGESPKKVTQ